MMKKETIERIQKARRVVVKVGSAILSAPDGRGFARPIMAELSQQIAELRDQGREIVLVSSGAILAGRQILKAHSQNPTMGEKQALAALGQVELMRHWSEIFSWNNTLVAQVLLTRDDVSNRHRFLNARRTLCHLLEMGIVPIVNENDTVMVEEIRLGDNDQLSAMITNLVNADLLVLLTEVDGLYSADPRHDPEAQLVPFVSEVTSEIQGTAGKPGPSGRGGMATKIEAARQASLAGVPTIIANGRIHDILKRIFTGHCEGTLVAPSKQRLDSREQWIAFTHEPIGQLVLDEGAIRAVVEEGCSLLASGILAVRGRFEVGDRVELVSADGAVSARGIVSYSSVEVDRIKGLKSHEIESVLGYKTTDAVVQSHRLAVQKKGRRLTA